MKCLVVEDDPMLNEVVTEMLQDLGHVCTSCDSISSAQRALFCTKFDLIVLDYSLPDGYSTSLSDYISVFCPNSRTILLTGSDVYPNGEHAIMAPGIDWLLRKPVGIRDLEALVHYAARDAAQWPTQAYAMP